MSTRYSLHILLCTLVAAMLAFLSTTPSALALEVSGRVGASANASTTRPMPVKEQLKERMENIREAKAEMQERRSLASSSASTTLRARAEMKLTERREAVAKKLEEVKTKVLSRFGTEALNQFKKVDDRLSDALSRLGEGSAKIDSRIAKLKAENVDMTTAEALNVEAKAKLTDAQAKVNAIVVPTLPRSASTTKEQINASLKTAREQVKAAEVAIQTAREAFMKVLAEIRAKGGTKAEAQLDASTSTSN